MVDRFLISGGVNADVSNGSVDIFARTLGSDNLSPSFPVKTDANRRFISTRLDIADINNLQATLNTAVLNPLQSNLDANNLLIFDVSAVELIKSAAPANPPAGSVKLYASTADSKLHFIDESGTDIAITFDQQLNTTDSVSFAGVSSTSTLNMNSNQINNVADPTLAQDAATKNYTDTTFLSLAGGTMTGDITNLRTDDRKIAIGDLSASVGTQGALATALGAEAGFDSQGGGCVAIGYSAGRTNQTDGAVAVGELAGATTQGENSVAIGASAGSTLQGPTNVAVGYLAGEQNQTAACVAVGIGAGRFTQGLAGIAIGQSAGNSNQGANAIAIGNGAGVTSQPTNSLVISASSTPTVPAGSNEMFIRAGTTTLVANATNIQHNGTNLKFDQQLNTTDDITFNTLNISSTTASTSQTTGALVVAGGAGFGGNVYASSLLANPVGVIQSGSAFRMDTGTGASCNLQLLRTDTNRWSFTNNVASSTLFNVYSTAPENSAVLISSYVFGRSAGATSSGQLAYAYNGVDVTTANAGGNLNKISLCHVGTACDLDLFRDGSMYVNGGQLRYDQGNKAGVGNNGLKILDITASTSSSTGALQVSGGVGIVGDMNIDGKINNATPSGGIFSQIADSTAVTNTVTETTLIGSGVGSLTVPANKFKAGDTYLLHFAGDISNLNNETLTIRVYGGTTSTTLLNTLSLTIPTTTTKNFDADIHIIIRAIGAAGVASVFTHSKYEQTTNTSAYSNISNNTNTTTFDTTVANTLNFTAQWGTASASNTITCKMFTLEKFY